MARLTGLFRIGRDTEVRYTPNGNAVVNLSLAYSYGKRSEGNTQWVDATLWGALAESLQPYLTRGTQIEACINDIHLEEYTKNDQSKGVKLTGIITSIELAGSKSQDQQTPQQNFNQQQNNQGSKPQQKNNTNQQSRPNNSSGQQYANARDGYNQQQRVSDMDDEIPF